MKTKTNFRIDPNLHYLRNCQFIALTHKNTCAFHGNGEWFEIDAEDSKLVSAILQYLSQPRLGSDLQSFLINKGETIAQRCLDKLISKKVILTGHRNEVLKSFGLPLKIKKPCRRLVFGVTGAIQASIVIPFIFMLTDRFCEQVDIILTQTATKFLSPLWLQHRGMRTWTDMFQRQGEINVPHIELAMSADLIVVMPASAHFMQRLANGAAGDLLTLVCMSTSAPTVIVPSTNEAIWTNRAVQRNVNHLKADGYYLVEPGQYSDYPKTESESELAVGYGGTGVPYNQPEALLAVVRKILDLNNRKNNI